MRKHFFLFVLPAICMSLLLGASAGSAQAAERREPAVRELYIPFEQLNILLENQPRRVLLSRQEYEELLTQAKSRPPTTVPGSGGDSVGRLPGDCRAGASPD